VVIFRSPQNHDALSDKAFAAVKFCPELLRSFTISLFAFVCHLNVVSVAGELVNPSLARIEKVAFRVSALLFIFYALIGVLGYYSFGSSVSQNFINNFSDSGDSIYIICRLLLTLTLLFSLPITANPTSHAIVHYALALHLAEDNTMIGEPLRGIRIVSACAVLGVSALVANFIPGVADVLSILGGVFGNLLMLVFPSVIARAIFRYDFAYWRAFAITLMAAGSMLCFVAVGYTVLNAVGIV
jgi:amino acid permease